MLDKRLEGMMDCIKQAFLDGCQRGLEFDKMRYGIIAEMKRLGLDASEIKDKLEEWNKRCEKVLGPSELKSQLFNFVDWAFEKKVTRIGCRAMTACGFCLGKDKCQFYLKKYTSNRKATVRPQEYWMGISRFLNERYKGHVGRELMLIVQVLRDYQHEKGTGEIILISFRRMCSLLRDKHDYNILPMEAKRKVWHLINEGIIEITIQGKSGTFRQLANGYRFLPFVWPPNTDSSTTTHINPYV